MRTTLTIDDRLAAELKEEAQREGVSFKEVVNRALARGLDAIRKPGRRGRYRVTTHAMGDAQGLDLDRALRIADGLEDEEIARKLEQRK